MKNKNQTRGDVEKLIRSLLDWASKQPEYTTGIYPDNDRVVNPVDKLQLAGLAEKAKYLLQDTPNHQETFWNFTEALGQNNVTSIIITLPKLVDALCEFRNTLEGDNSKEISQEQDDDSPDYENLNEMLIFLQRILPDNDYIQGMSLKKFSKEVKNPDNKIRFKTKGHRCKVHKADIMDFIKSNLPKEISDEDIETYLKEVEQRKKEIFLAKIRENGP